MSGLIGKGKLLWVPVSWKAGSRDLSRANREKRVLVERTVSAGLWGCKLSLSRDNRAS